MHDTTRAQPENFLAYSWFEYYAVNSLNTASRTEKYDSNSKYIVSKTEVSAIAKGHKPDQKSGRKNVSLSPLDRRFFPLSCSRARLNLVGQLGLGRVA